MLHKETRTQLHGHKVLFSEVLAGNWTFAGFFDVLKDKASFKDMARLCGYNGIFGCFARDCE